MNKPGRPKTLNLAPARMIAFDQDNAKQIQEMADEYGMSFAAVVRMITEEYFREKAVK